MNSDLYTQLCDDAQQLIGQAEQKMFAVRDMLVESRRPGLMLKGGVARHILAQLGECKAAVDDLPATLEEGSL